MIETQRLIIREFGDDDFAALYAIVSNPEIMRYSDGPESEAAARVRLAGYRTSYEKNGFGKWAVLDKSANQVIGYCGFGIEVFEGQSHRELGYRLLRPYWGRGIACEAASACSQYGFSTLEFSDYIAFAHPDNVASWRILQKIGMSYLKSSSFHGYPVRIYEMKY